MDRKNYILQFDVWLEQDDKLLTGWEYTTGMLKDIQFAALGEEALEDLTSGRCMYIVKSVVIDWAGAPFVQFVMMVTSVTCVHSSLASYTVET